MKTIGLLDIDCHGAKKKWGATIYPNLALCKIAAYHKGLGDRVEWATPFEHYDILYRSKIFNFTQDDLTPYNADLEIRGGTGYDIHSELPQEIDDIQPDLSIYPNVPKDISYGFLTRGCPNKCKWCVVPKKEGGNHVYAYAQPYRDPLNPRHRIPQWQKDMANWCNKKQLFSTIPFEEFEVRKGFKCSNYYQPKI